MNFNFLKNLISGPDAEFKKLTPGYFSLQKSRMGIEKYRKWLLKKRVYYSVMISVEEKKSTSIPQNWIDGLKLIENELENEKVQQIPWTSAVKKNNPKRIIFIVFSIITTMIVGYLGIIYYGNLLDNKSQTYVDVVVPIIINSWSSEEFVNYVAPELLESTSEDKVNLLFNNYRKFLGDLKEYRGSEGQAISHTEIFCEEGFLCTGVTADYTIEAVFEKGLAKINIGLLQRFGKWEIISFSVVSDEFEKINRESSSEYLNNMENANKLLREKKFFESSQKAEEALLFAETDEGKAEAHYLIGLPNFKLGNVKKAEEEYKQAIILNPEHASSYSSMASVYSAYGQFDKAVESAQKAISISPNYAWAYSNLGTAYANLGEEEKSIQEYETAILIAPDIPDFHSNLALSYNLVGRNEEAVDEFNIALKLDPNFEKAYLGCGKVYISQQKTDKAIEIYKEGIRNIPNSSELYYGLALIPCNNQEFDSCERELKSVINYNKNYTNGYLTLFDLYIVSNKLDELKLLITQYSENTGRSKEQIKNEIVNTAWINNKQEIIKALEDAM